MWRGQRGDDDGNPYTLAPTAFDGLFLGWCISDAQNYPHFYPLWGIAFARVFDYSSS